MDLSILDEKSIKIMAKLMLALMQLNVTLYDFFDGVIYEQLVKTKTKQNTIEIINTKDFYDMLQQRGVRKKNTDHENLSHFLQLDPNYPNLVMLKKVAKALDEMAKNEELMAGLLEAAGDEGEGGEQYYEGEQFEGEQQPQQRLITIGEDGEEDRHFDTNKDNSKGVLPPTKAALVNKAQVPAEDEEDDYNDDEDDIPQQYRGAGQGEENYGDDYEDDNEDYDF